MISSRFEILLILLRLVLLFPNSTEALGVSQKLVPDICLGNSSSSVYQKNVNDLLSSLLSQGNGSGFYSSSRGQSPDKVYAIGLCRGDVKLDVCGKCISDATYILTESCPNGTEATGWYDNCMLRYSKRPLYGVMESNKPSLRMCSPYDIGLENTDDFNRKLTALLGRLKSAAAAGGDLKYAAGNTTYGSMSQSIFALLQCTPDLSEMDCSKCLGDTVESLPTTCPAKHGARIDFLSCYLRYEDALFFNSVAATTPPPISSPPPGARSGEKKQSKNSRTVIIIVVAIIVPLLLILSICIYLKLRKTKARFEDCIHEPGAEALQFDFDSIKVATNNFSKSNELGRGGFGVVYKGKLWNQEDIAVKRLSKNSAQGDIEFKNEVVLVAKLQHRNLVKLLGFCLEKNERLLVYEFVSNSSLDNFIFDPKMRGHLDWDTRYKIIVGIGRGLLYLHEDSRLRIIHRDLKASNILLDAEMTPKIADFGMARLFDIDQTQGQTSRIAGTHGYMAPEYVMRGHFSVKSDVYSFGVLVLEIVSGKKNNSFYQGRHAEDLISYVWRSWREETASSIIDHLTLTTDSRSEAMRCIHIGLLCLQQSVGDRPTMASVMQMLTSNSLTPPLPVPSQPSFLLSGSDISGLDQSHSKAKQMKEVSITEQSPR